MLDNWLKPISNEVILQIDSLSENQFGAKINTYNDKLPDLSNTDLVLIGLKEKEANAIRKHLFSTIFPPVKLNITDIGNIRNEADSFPIPVIKELVKSNILPIIIGGDVSFFMSQFQAYLESNDLLNTVFIQRDLDDFYNPSSKNPLLQIISNHREKIFNASLIAYQAPYTNHESLDILKKNYFDVLRLGRIKSDIKITEPIIRDADFVFFNINAVRFADAPGQEYSVPSGLTLEESCQIGRYCGMNEKLGSFGVYGYFNDKDINELAAKMIAQIMWYFIEGFSLRSEDALLDSSTQKYVIDAKLFDRQITFLKSSSSGRWWMLVPQIRDKVEQRHMYIPCSFEDYEQAKQDTLPERLINAIYRFN